VTQTDHHIRHGGNLGHAGGGAAAEAGDLVHRLVAGVVEEGQLEPAPCQHIAGNAVAHEANADQSDTHGSLPMVLPGPAGLNPR